MTAPFTTNSAAAWAALDVARTGGVALTRKSAGFLGETAVDPTPLSPKQADWLGKLLAKAGLPPLQNDGGDHE